VVESGVSMNSAPQEMILAATIHRVKMCEDKIKDFEQMVSTLTSQMAKNRAELASKGLANLVMGVSTPCDIPRELKPTLGKFRMPKNRSHSVVTKRWTLWKHQLEAGMSTSEIARHWGCHHTSIINAKKRNFTARKSTGRGK
jgi:hypothetical protein